MPRIPLVRAELPPPRSPLPAAHVRIGDVDLQVTAASARVFHLVVTAAGAAAGAEPSPFIVQSEEWNGIRSGEDASGRWFQLPAGRLSVSPQGAVTLRDRRGAVVFQDGRIARNAGGWKVSWKHGAQDRFYGSGNAERSRSGGLVKREGVSAVENGATRLPFLWSATGGWGILIANNRSGIGWTDRDRTLTWSVPAPFVDLYVILGDDPYALLDGYAQLTGRAPLPPRWTLGYMQSRWGYRDSADVQDKWREFRRRRIPVDAFIYDYDWFVEDWKFNPRTFPDPARDLETMRGMGLKFVGIRKPRVREANLAYARRQGWIFSRNQIRFDLPEARQWWWGQHAPLMRLGVAGWWNDEAEHSYDQFFHMCRTQWDGWRAADPRRVWTLNRAFAPGMQRFGAAVWTGDVACTWDALRNQPGTMLNYSLCGMPFVGQDIGGFTGTPTPELYARWMQEGVFVPVMRAHGILNSPRWPWAFGERTLQASRRAIELRYRLLPYLYTVTEESSRTGAPWMRPLFLEFPDDPRFHNLEDQWLVGRSLLAAPVLAPGGARTVLLPGGRWYDFNTGRAVSGPAKLKRTVPLDTIPIYLRAGAILPLGPVVQHTEEPSAAPLEIRVYPGADGAFTLYEDQGDTYDYQRGAFSRIPFRWDDRGRTLRIGARSGSYPGMPAARAFRIVLPDKKSRGVLYRGSAVTITL